MNYSIACAARPNLLNCTYLPFCLFVKYFIIVLLHEWYLALNQGLSIGLITRRIIMKTCPFPFRCRSLVARYTQMNTPGFCR